MLVHFDGIIVAKLHPYVPVEAGSRGMGFTVIHETLGEIVDSRNACNETVEILLHTTPNSHPPAGAICHM